MRYEEASASIVMALAGLAVSPVIIIVAGLVLAAVVAIAAVFLLRSGKNKGAKAGATPGSASGWQPQQNQQVGAPGAAGWNQGAAAQGQGDWGAPQQQQGWGAPQQQQPAGWGAQENAQQGWGAPQQQQQPAANQWGAAPQGAAGAGQQQGWGAAPAQPAAPSQWDQGQNANQWNNAATQAAQDPWGQPQQQQPVAPANSWGAVTSQPQTPQAGQNAPTAYGGGGSGPSWGQPVYGNNQAPADQWGAAPVPAAGGTVPSWQQPGGFAPADSDKTILRAAPGAGSQAQMGQGALGVVRVEEGKEPGREYEIRKPSLSIGRSRESDIFLEDLAVSRLHASIVNKGSGMYELKDEGSANGTKLNGQQVSKYQSLPLNEGDKIQLGQTVLVFARR